MHSDVAPRCVRTCTNKCDQDYYTGKTRAGCTCPSDRPVLNWVDRKCYAEAELCTARRRRQLQELCFGTNAWLSLLATQLVDCLPQLERCGALPPDPKLAKKWPS